MSENLEKILFVLVGWILGLLSLVIMDLVRRWNEAKEVKTVLRSELLELQYKIAVARYVIEAKFFGVEREMFVWLQPIVNTYSGINEKESIKNLVNTALKEKEGYRIPPNKKDEDDVSLLKKYPVSVLENKLGTLSWYDQKFQGQIIDLISNVQILNQIVDDFRYFYQLSFQELSTENYERAKSNLIQTYENYSSRAKIIVDLINKIDF